jgi:hypothetical protein
MEHNVNMDNIDDKINRATRNLNDMLNVIDTATTNTTNRNTPSATGKSRYNRGRSRSPAKQRITRNRSPSLPPRRRDSTAQDVRCYNCNKKGHYSSDCKEKCKYCGSKNHNS